MADKYANLTALAEFLSKIKAWANNQFATKAVATTSADGLLSSSDKTKLNGIATGATNVVESTVSGWGFTKNAGTVTGINMNGTSKGTSGVVDLGTVITAHQDISGKQDKITPITAQSTQAVYPVKIDAQGHITSYGSAVTSKSAASGGTDISLVTTGEKFTWNSKQDALVSGTNIKTINSTSILGSGNIITGNVNHNTDVEAGSAVTLNADQLQGYNLNGLIDLFYPVGSIYSSTVSTSPATLFGRGTWVAIGGETGGEYKHQLTVDEMPNHSHRLGIGWSTGGGDGVGRVDANNGQNRWGIEATGGNQSHNNMPPYLAVYIWKRTA